MCAQGTLKGHGLKSCTCKVYTDHRTTWSVIVKLTYCGKTIKIIYKRKFHGRNIVSIERKK